MNPYSELGIQPDAELAAIKAAYRNSVKLCHPDVEGSDRDKFERVHWAYQILTDPERRAKFDATGVAEEVTPDNSHLGVIQHVVMAMIKVLASNEVVNPEDFDLVAATRTTLHNHGAEISKARTQTIKAADRLERAAARMRRNVDDNTPDMITLSMKGQARQMRDAMERLEGEVKKNNAALDLLDRYSFEVTGTLQGGLQQGTFYYTGSKTTW